MREIVIFCDVHRARGESIPAQGVPVTLNNAPRVTDLCSECYGLYVQPLATVLDEHGIADVEPTSVRKRKRNRGSKASGEYPVQPNGKYACPECSREFTNPQGCGLHRRQVHGIVALRQR